MPDGADTIDVEKAKAHVDEGCERPDQTQNEIDAARDAREQRRELLEKKMERKQDKLQEQLENQQLEQAEYGDYGRKAGFE